MRGEKVVTFDFDITYPNGQGGYETTREIRLRAPGLGKSEVFFTLKAYASKAVTGFAKIQSEIQQGRKKDASDDDEDETPKKDAKQDDVDTMYLMASGLDIPTFAQFSNYLRRAITNTPKLASMGDSKAALSDEVWENIDTNGGMEAVNKVLAAYIDFFLEPLIAPSKTGSDESTGSATPARDTSRTTSVKTSHSKK